MQEKIILFLRYRQLLQSGAPLLGLAKSKYYILIVLRIYMLQQAF